MGWVSYSEDIAEANAENAAQTSKHDRMPRDSTTGNQQIGSNDSSARTRRRRRKEGDLSLDRPGPRSSRDEDLLSGHSQIVAIVAALRQVNSESLLRVGELEQEVSDARRLHQNNTDLRRHVRSLEADLKAERTRRRKAEYDLKELDRRLAASPEGMQRMIDAYSRRADIDFHKPGERKW